MVLPLCGALLAYRLTLPAGEGFLRVAEAPRAEVAGAQVRAAARLPANVDAAPSQAAQAPLSLTLDVLALRMETPDGATIASNSATPASPVVVSYRVIDPPAPAGPGPHILRLVDVDLTTASGAPLGRLAAPLTLTIPYRTGGEGAASEADESVSVTMYDAAAGAWVDIPGRAIDRRRGTVSAPVTEPAAFAVVENRPPAPAEDAATTTAETPVVIDVLANDADPDGDALGVFLEQDATEQGGRVSCTQSGRCNYTPPAGFTGNDAFIYGLGDLRAGGAAGAWRGHRAEGRVVVTVLPPTPPTS